MQTMMYKLVMKDEDICHYGIPLQKWGLRRFQNPDGTLTEEGKRRYYKPHSENRISREKDRQQDEEDREYRREQRRKKIMTVASTAAFIAAGAAILSSLGSTNYSSTSTSSNAYTPVQNPPAPVGSTFSYNSSSSSSPQQNNGPYRTWVSGEPNPSPSSKGPKVQNAKFKPYTEPKTPKFKAEKVSSSMFKGNKSNIIDADVVFDDFVSSYSSSGQSYTTNLLDTYGDTPLLTDNSFYPPARR